MNELNRIVTDRSPLKLSATKLPDFSHQITTDNLPTVATDKVQKMPTSSCCIDMFALVMLSKTSALIKVLRSRGQGLPFIMPAC